MSPVNTGMLLGLLLACQNVIASEDITGKQLHDQHCVSCHSPDIYTRPDSMIHSYRDLTERVRLCELSNELTWFDEEVEAVVDYLNSTYYRFGKE